MRLQKSTSLALYSVIEFAIDPERHISAAEIAKKYGASPHHLAKVLSELARADVVESVRGVGGGYRFIGNARRLTLMDIIQLYENFGQPPVARGEATLLTPVEMALGAVLSEIDEIAKATFNSITLETMLRLIKRQQVGASSGPVQTGDERNVARSGGARASDRKSSPRRKSA
jgi:Rrf2 family protein